jgi:hypothetical protein
MLAPRRPLRFSRADGDARLNPRFPRKPEHTFDIPASPVPSRRTRIAHRTASRESSLARRVAPHRAPRSSRHPASPHLRVRRSLPFDHVRSSPVSPNCVIGRCGAIHPPLVVPRIRNLPAILTRPLPWRACTADAPLPIDTSSRSTLPTATSEDAVRSSPISAGLWIYVRRKNRILSSCRASGHAPSPPVRMEIVFAATPHLRPGRLS